ncbi:MAG TPA: ABC transporter ATP-binding protein [candidate division Zixibacteria bacterium]|nr:ABC transporter ATP-binding protein [candidate division Zixibacteria bacterium]
MSASALVRAEGIAFGYPLPGGKRRPVLRGVDLAVRRGEVLGVLGPNGSGKTTLLRLITGVLRPDAGSVTFAGVPVGEWPRSRLARRVAVLPQHLELPAGFRVAELVEMGRTPHARRWFGSTADDERAVLRALVEADAMDLAGRTADELSGGERQRVLVAMALAQEPELLLLDEPTLHLDLAHQVSLLATLHRLREQRDLTVVAVLHDLNLAAAFAPRVVVLHEGRVAVDGAPDAVLAPALISRVFGVATAEAWTAEGQRHLALADVTASGVRTEATTQQA